MLSIATRGSILALWQARHVEEGIASAHPHLNFQMEVLRTTGDRITDVPLSKIGDRGIFTRELDNALLDGRADCAVHSLKDLPTLVPEGLVIAAVLEREDPRDAWLSGDGQGTIFTLPSGACVGTSSLRRRALLLSVRPDLDVADVRGNLDTRLAKLANGGFDAMILAYAGLRRLGRADAVTHLLDEPDWLPAPGQGAIAIVTRADDKRTRAIVQHLHHAATGAAVTAERAFLRTLEGGCQVPIGALATVEEEGVHLQALVADPDGGSVVRGLHAGSDAATVGIELAGRMLGQGADTILRRLRDKNTRNPPQIAEP